MYFLKIRKDFTEKKTHEPRLEGGHFYIYIKKHFTIRQQKACSRSSFDHVDNFEALYT